MYIQLITLIYPLDLKQKIIVFLNSIVIYLFALKEIRLAITRKKKYATKNKNNDMTMDKPGIELATFRVSKRTLL